ncbi:MAG: hypothetical protein ACLQVW_30635 [Limisphaerales bacterium]
MALLVAWLGLHAALTAAPVNVPDASFELSIFPDATNSIAAGAQGTPFNNNGVLTPVYDWWATGAADATETNNLGQVESYPTEYVQNASTNGTQFFPLNSDGTLIAPGDGTNYLVLGGSGDLNVWQAIGPVQSNTVYTLTVAVGIDLLNGYLPADSTTGYGGGTALMALVQGTQNYDIFTPGAIIASRPIQNTNYALGSWVDNVLVFTNGYMANGDLTILFRGTGGFAVDLDNIRLDATPATFTAVQPTATTDLGSNTTTVFQGTPVTLSENPVGVPPFTYAWQTDNGSKGATWSAIAGANGTNYVADTSSIKPGTPVQYEVIVTGASSVSTSAPVALTTLTNAPILVWDTLPSSGSFDVIGSTVGFSAIFDGSRPIAYQWQLNGQNIQGATNEWLTLNLTDTNQSGAYGLIASNAFGTNNSTPQTFTVNALPDATNGIVVSQAMEWGPFSGTLGYNQPFDPTWTLPATSVIAGLQPSSSIGIFTDAGCGGLSALTDGSFADIAPPANGAACFATCGDGTTTNGIGYSITYTLPTTPGNTGWTITNITSYGGWVDSGREEQTYQIAYSSPLAPTNFSLLPWTAFNPPDYPAAVAGNGVATATKMSIIPTNGVLAKNVAALQINFYSLAAGQTPKNGWEGYAQFQVFGAVSTTFPPAVTQSITPATGWDVEGSSVTIEAGFVSIDPITYTWLKDGTPIPGQTNSTLTLTNLQLTDTAVSPGYVLQASNQLGVSSSQPCAFTVNPAPTPDGNGINFLEAGQAVPGGLLTPTWVIPTNSLLAGLEPYLYAGNFQAQNSANGRPEGGIPTLTDGQYGAVGEGDTLTGASMGPGDGEYLYYALPASSNGWDITSIQTYGGWSDIGRNNQGYDFYYATAADPDNFIELDSINPAYSPPVTVAEPNANRVIWTSGLGGPLATNVVAVEFVFDVTVFNGWEGYNELQVFGTKSSVPQAVIPQAPIVVTDVAPGYGSDVAGSAVTFTANISGSAPISYQWQFTSALTGQPANLPGATNETLTLTDLNTNMTGSYLLTASNLDGVITTSSAEFTVNPVPAPSNGIVYAAAAQIDGNEGLGLLPDAFLPTWNIATGSLIAGQLPSTVGPGNFQDQTDAGGVPVLTDGVIGELVSGGEVPNYATCGNVASGTGQYVIYTLKGSASGYNINSIVTYGGWPDYGRDYQYYTVLYSTVAEPTNFITLGQSAYQFPQLRPGAAPNASRITWTSAGAGPLASNVAAVEFNFTLPAGQENNWQGYSELQLFGTPSQSTGPKGPTISSTTVSGGNLILAGSGGTPGAAYAWLTATNLTTPLPAWTQDGAGTFDSSGNFSTSIPIKTTESARFFRLSTP